MLLTKKGEKSIDRIRGAVGARSEATSSIVSRTRTVPAVSLCKRE